MNKNILASVIASVIVVVLGFTFFGGDTKTIETRTVVEKQLGAVSSLDNVDTPYVSIGGKKQYFYSQGMFATSSVVCSIKNPYNATSTLLRYGFQVTSNGIASAQTLDVSTSTSAYASSSPAFIKKFAGGAGQFSAAWTGATSTNLLLMGVNGNGGVGSNDTLIGPTEFITLKVASGTPGTYPAYYTGTCSGVIEKL